VQASKALLDLPVQLVLLVLKALPGLREKRSRWKSAT
jgi:hypothetical protein